MKANHILLIILLSFIMQALPGYVADYEVKAMGLKLATVRIENNTGAQLINVSVKSVYSNRIFPPVDNRYQVNYVSGYYPVKYYRKIHQNDLRDSVMVYYNRDNKTASANSTQSKIQGKYKISSEIRDYFSFFTMLTLEDLPTGKYVIDGNGCPWMASVDLEKIETIHTDIGKFTARKYNISFQNMTANKMPYIDMITHNLLNEDTTLNLWISTNHIAVKASMRKKTVSMIWDMIGYSD
ncbi:MAG: hypothetical protein CVU48_03990 [Candidatus Cloacimonetes bacterium HGW-Cloacimonetes-1]|jgi:hypothetical protein|nr:MAG: hypothetical protein CVU48_03990 [Candidatus Cloacimonetes bacterium HGW-Cloacimonetes-1]